MKASLIALVLACGLVFSCTDTKEDAGIIDKDKDLIDYVELDSNDMSEITLSDYDLNMAILLPIVANLNGEEIKPEIVHDDGDYLWFINIGKYFHLVIEDYANEFNKVSEEKQRLLSMENIFSVEYIINRNDLIFYKRQLVEGNGGKPTYHCFGEISIEGYNYILRSEDGGSMKQIVQDMVTSIKSARAIKGA